VLPGHADYSKARKPAGANQPEEDTQMTITWLENGYRGFRSADTWPLHAERRV
jgi:hypothetical protein